MLPKLTGPLPMEPLLFGGAVLAGLVVLVTFFWAWDELIVKRGGRLVLLAGACILPLIVSGGGVALGVENSGRTTFCLECHEMQDYGKSLFADNRQALAAVHYQDRQINRKHTCYACHTNYALFGDIKAKLNGLRHVWVHYLGEIPQPVKIYEPYPNNNCLHCHDDARRYLQAPEHKGKFDDFAHDRQSCLECHNVAHDMQAVKEGRFWIPEAP
jgi:cytochrome c-type protein NapC